MDSISFRHKVAEAVHRAVCRFSESDGLGQCQLYAVAGAALLTRLTKRLFLPQAGTLRVLAEEPDGWLVTDPRNWDDPEIALSAGHFHCWVADVTGTEPGIGHGKTLIDFSSRHYRSLAWRCVGESLTWTRPEPPAFVWIDDGMLPDWLRLIPQPGVTQTIIEKYFDHPEVFGPLIRQAVMEHDRLLVRTETSARIKLRRKSRKAERQRRKNCRSRR